MFVTTVGMLFIAGAKLWQFLAMLAAAVLGIALLIVFEPYRLRRVTSFMDPWEDPFGSGYQLTQSLMAFGRGDWLGQGLGNSIQKLEYLPEAHTDFVFAVLAEEVGLLGVTVVLLLIFFLWFSRRSLSAENACSQANFLVVFWHLVLASGLPFRRWSTSGLLLA